MSQTTITVVRSRHVFGEILVDKTMPEDSVRIYRVDEDGNTAFDVTLKIPSPEESCSTRTSSTPAPSR